MVQVYFSINVCNTIVKLPFANDAFGILNMRLNFTRNYFLQTCIKIKKKFAVGLERAWVP